MGLLLTEVSWSFAKPSIHEAMIFEYTATSVEVNSLHSSHILARRHEKARIRTRKQRK